MGGREANPQGAPPVFPAPPPESGEGGYPGSQIFAELVEKTLVPELAFRARQGNI